MSTAPATPKVPPTDVLPELASTVNLVPEMSKSPFIPVFPSTSKVPPVAFFA